MKFTNQIKIGVAAAIVAAVAFHAYSQSRESQFGLSVYATGGKYFPLGTVVTNGVNSTNDTNIIIVPMEAYNPGLNGAAGTSSAGVAQINYIDALTTAVVYGASGTPNITYFFSTNSAGVFAGANASTDPRTAVTGSTNSATYSTNATGSATNAFWLNGVVPGVINGQWGVVKHQGYGPMANGYEPIIIIGSAVVYWTNSFTNGANQVTALVQSNTCVVVQNWSQLALPINSGDFIWLEQTNYSTVVSTNAPTVSARYTQASAGGISSGERGKPLLVAAFGTNMQMSLNANILP